MSQSLHLIGTYSWPRVMTIKLSFLQILTDNLQSQMLMYCLYTF
jgi:hypothetical protein